MIKPLPSPWALITDSWAFYRSRWNDTVKVSIWFLYGGLIQFASTLILTYAPELGLVAFLLVLASVFFMFVGGLRLIKAVLQFEAGKTYPINKEEVREAVRAIPSLLWIGILQALIVLAGFILLVIPGIYLSVLLTFSSLIYFTEGKRGTQALQGSRELVNGRWWPTFGRLLLGGLIFGLGVGIVAGIVVAIITGIVGPTNVARMADGSAQASLYNGTIELLQTIIQTAVLPLFVGFQVKLFRALQKTR